MKSFLGMSDDQHHVLIVDDSFFVRKTLGDLIESFDNFSVVGKASNGEEALKILSRESVDVMTLDVYMPDMNGLDTLQSMNRRDYDVPVLMLSRATTDESRETTRALSLGAADVLAKPSGSEDETLKDLRGTLREHLVTLTKSADGDEISTEKTGIPGTTESSIEEKLDRIHPELFVLGGSTGALTVVRSILESLDSSFPLPVAIVQHIAEPFLAGLADNLSMLTSMETVAVTEATVAEPGKVYLLGCPDRHLTVRRGNDELLIRPYNDDPVNRSRPSVDVLFESAERALGKDVLAILLSGMGEDGARGMKKLHDSGALCVAQDQSSSVVHGMPSSALDRGAVDTLASDEELPELINEWIMWTRSRD